MKNSILTILAIAAMTSCEKKENTAVNQSADMPATTPDTAMAVKDSATTTASADTKMTLTDQDKKFADAAAKGGLMEVMMGQLAAGNGTNAAVKELGKMMASDHGKANDELKSWATKAGYTLPTKLDAEKQKMYDDLKAKKGSEFDKMYADMMVTDHKKDIAEFEEEASKGGEASLKAFASKTVPTLEHHLMESEKTKAALK